MASATAAVRAPRGAAEAKRPLSDAARGVEASEGARGARWARGFFSATGSLRTRNEDRCRFAKDGAGGVVVDGMGGHPGGALFAECLSWQIARLLEHGVEPADALRAAGEKAHELAGIMGIASGGAVAACATLGNDGAARLARVGDARALVAGQDGSLCDPLAACRDRRGPLSCTHLGPGQHHPLIVGARVRVPVGGAVLLLSDGAALYPPREALTRAVAAACAGAGANGPDEAAERAARDIVRAAQAHGSPDDATALVMVRLA